MAQKHIVQLIDDLDEGPADETVSFSIDGNAYEIDLNEKNAAGLRDAMAKYVANARRGGRAATRPSARAASGGPRSSRPGRVDREQTQAIREWARTNGFKVGEKGRIPGHIVEAYNTAN